MGSYSVSAAQTTANQPAADTTVTSTAEASPTTETPVANQPATVTASNNAARAATTPIEDYHISEEWTLTDNINNRNVNNNYINNDSSTNAFASASTVIKDEYGNSIDVTATLGPHSPNTNGVAFLTLGSNYSSYGATSEMFVGNPNPSDISALGVMTQVASGEGGNNLRDRWHFNGEFPEAIITFKFSKEVTNPILDISGLGGDNDIAAINERPRRCLQYQSSKFLFGLAQTA